MPGYGNRMRGASGKFLLRIRPPGRAFGAVAIAFALTLCLGHLSSGRQAGQDAIRRKAVVAETLFLQSSDGKTAAIFGLDPGNQIAINFFNPQNTGSLQVGVFRGGSSSITLRSAVQKTNMTLSVLPSGQPLLRLGGTPPRTGLLLAIGTDDAPAFTLDRNGVSRVSLSRPDRTNDSLGLGLLDGDGKTAMRLSRSKTLTHMSLNDKQAHVRMLLGSMVGKDPALMLYDDDIHALVEMTADATDRPIIRLNDPVTRDTQTLR